MRALELAEAGASLVPGDDRLWSAGTRRPTLVAGLELSADVLGLPAEEILRIGAKTGEGVAELLDAMR